MRVGFIGLGTMGQHLANHLQEGGYDLVVNDIREERATPHLTAGAEWAATPSAVMAACDVVFTSVPTPADVEAIALGPNGLIESAAQGKVFFDMSTNSPTVMRRIHDRFEPLGVAVLDAPVSGGASGAQSGQLVIFVGGDESVYEGHRAMLATMGDQPFYVGPIGAGSVAKLVHNLATQSINLAINEAMTMGVRAGVDPLLLWRSIRFGAAGRRRTFDFTRAFTGGFDTPTFRLALARKDVRLAVELGHELNVPMRLSSLTLDELTEAVERGWGDRDFSAAYLLQQERGGVHIEFSQQEVDETLAE
jgi:3-hydroxyisobutyrate dehydrogenase